MIHVQTKIARPAPALIEAFRLLGSATVHEASGREGYVDCALRPIAFGVRLCGPAFTVSCGPRDNLMLHKALELAKPGDILLVDTGGHYQAGYLGGLMATSAVARKIGGLAIDGGIRDSAEIIQMGFPVFCRCFSLLGTTKSVLGLINHPLVFGGARVNPGDIILGDNDGLVVVARERGEEVLAKAQARVAMEEQKTRELASGVSSVKFNKLDRVFEFLGMKEE
jgi:4-hydroxy-4-methyl-2-oxoglutarate aldolase